MLGFQSSPVNQGGGTHLGFLTPDGFYSIVQKGGETDLSIRARAGADLDRLREPYLPTLYRDRRDARR